VDLFFPAAVSVFEKWKGQNRAEFFLRLIFHYPRGQFQVALIFIIGFTRTLLLGRFLIRHARMF
jgi:hypothetical protein